MEALSLSEITQSQYFTEVLVQSLTTRNKKQEQILMSSEIVKGSSVRL